MPRCMTTRLSFGGHTQMGMVNKRNAMFMVDADAKTGLGHLLRCLTLADALKEKKIKSFFLMRFSTPQTRRLVVDRQFEVFTRVQTLERIISNSDIGFMIADVSHPKTLADPSKLKRWIEQARNLGVRTIVFDGLVADCVSQKVNLPADVIVIPYVGADRLKLGKRTARFLKGAKYFIFRPEFLTAVRRKTASRVKHILVSMGGADPEGLTLKTIEALNHLDGFTATVIAGAGFRPGLIRKIRRVASRFAILNGSSNMAALMRASDFLITSSGLTKYEAARLGLPMIIMPQANYRMMPGGFEDRNLAIIASRSELKSVEKLTNLFHNVLADPHMRQRFAKRGQSILDGKGLERFLKEGVGI